MAPQSRHKPSSPCLVSVASVLLLFSNAAFATLPLVDFDRMGKVGIAGAFAGLGLLDNSSVSVDPSTATLISRNSDGSLSTLASTSPGGSILAGCALGNSFYFGGNFTSIGNTSASNVASYTPPSTFSALGSNGPDGEIRAIFCDTKENKVWVGGHFDSPSSAVAVWDPKSSSWSAPPFGGLAGAAAEVLSITTNASQSSIFFSGSFLTAFGNDAIPLNDTNNPNVPFSQGATPFSSSLVPIPLQNAQIEADPSSSESGFNNVQDILCPSSADGPGQSWFGGDGTQAVITVRDFSSLSARGIRLGNTFVDGRSTTNFSVTTIPDNTVQTLTFLDPQSGQNQTCSNPCPLSTDSSILYQDFLFNSNLDITGFQLTLTEWQGASPGLHILQLLSSGAFASAIGSDNSVSCFAPNPSNTTQTGTWNTKRVDTNIPGTTQEILVSDVAVGTSQSQAPTFTWMPYVSAAGEYQINLLIPGCTQFGDCALRTSVQVTVFPGDGLAPSVATIPQDNSDDQSAVIYSGPVVPSSTSFSTTITMTLATDPIGTGQNGQYELVADRVQLILTSANITADANGTTVNGTSGGQRGFGFFEWPLSATSVNATSALPNASLTSLDGIGLDLLQALGNGADVASSSSPSIGAVAHHPSGTIFLGGTFNLTSGAASGASNIVAFKNGALTALASNGLNAPVTSLAIDGDNLFIGGSFSDTASPSTQGKLQGVAMYDVQQNQWSSLDSGVNGAVSDLDVANGQLLVTGNFSDVVSSGNGLNQSNAGFATWNISNAAWVNSGGFLIGNLAFVANGTSSGEQFIAGNVAASLQFGATGFAMIQNGAKDVPTITPLGVELESSVTSNVTASTKRRRSHLRHSKSSWIPRFSVRHLFARQSSTTLAPLPASAPAPAPAVLAGAFWTNTSSSKELVVLGGNFSFSSGSSSQFQDVAIYDDSTGNISPLQGNQLNGIIRSLLVQGDELYIGGQFSLQGANVNGFVIYDLAQGQYDVSGFQALQASSGSDVIVRSITASPSQSDAIIIAGSFTQAGSNPCRAICSFGTTSKQWNALGNGIQGEVASVDYAGNNDGIIIAAGSIALADGTPANVAAFTIANGTWAAVGNGNDLPGPVTAVTVDNGNASSIFAAGRSADGSSSFLFFWNGKEWSNVGSSFQPTTDFSQLTMVPLQNTHAANGVIEPDRMLWISGTLTDSSFGNASSALFDGQNFIPYITSASSSGNPGVISALIHSFSTFSFTQKHFLAAGVVILISIAIAAGIVFLLVLIGILWTLFSRRDDKLAKYDATDVEDDDDSSHRPSSLLAHINAATRTTILGAQSPFAAQNLEQEGAIGAASMAADQDPFEPDASNYVRAETPSDAIAGTMGAEESRPAHARYSFDGVGDGELALTAGQEIEVLDDKDPSWWYARDARSGQEGVVPAAYVY